MELSAIAGFRLRIAGKITVAEAPFCRVTVPLLALAFHLPVRFLRDRGVSPSPSDLWNHRVSGKFENNLWGSISCGQNLEPQRLSNSLSTAIAHFLTTGGFRGVTLAEAMICFF